jgi:predicted phosphodiesterase
MKDGYRVLVLPDIHIEEGMDQTIAAAALQFGQWWKPDETIILGDLINFDYISHYTEKDGIAREGKRLKADFGMARMILKTISGFTSGKKIFTLGNHDMRLDIWVRQHPQIEGLLSLDYNLNLKQEGWDVINEGKVYKIGHAKFVHGWYWSKYHAHKTVVETGDNIFYGHVHDVQAYSKSNIDRQPIMGQSLGCLCNLNPEYKKNRPNCWVNAFGVFYFFSNGQFNHYIPIIVNSRFNFAGKIFDGNK